MLMDHIELSTVLSSALVVGGDNVQHDLQTCHKDNMIFCGLVFSVSGSM